MKYEIKFITHSIGFRVDNTIYLNKNLKKYPELYNKILKHEIEHIKQGKNRLKNYSHDIKEKFNKEIVFFCLKHPFSILHFFPIIIIEKKVTISWLYLYLYIIIIFWVYLVYFICMRLIL